jgi:nucleoside-diphosphate-sugar epimerase
LGTARKNVAVTGFPSSFVAVRVVRKLIAEERDIRVRCIVQERFLSQAAAELARLPGGGQRVDVIEGDTASMDLGLSGREFNALASEVDVIHHCAAVTYLGVEPEVAERVNVGGAREVVELAEAADHLERLVHWSTALVSGARRGYVLESELTATDGFRNVIEETRFRAERIIRRAATQFPTTILRPSIVVGDSVSGEIDRLEGPYLLVLLMLSAPSDLRIPLPGRGDIPLNLVPIDFVVDAGFAIVSDQRSLGRTFHIVDPEPLSVRRVFERIASATGRPLPRGFLPTNLATAILRTPGLERFANAPRAFLEQLATEVVYDDRNTREILDGTGIACPSFESYVDVLVAHVRRTQARRKREGPASEDHDPLA